MPDKQSSKLKRGVSVVDVKAREVKGMVDSHLAIDLILREEGGLNGLCRRLGVSTGAMMHWLAYHKLEIQQYHVAFLVKAEKKNDAGGTTGVQPLADARAAGSNDTGAEGGIERETAGEGEA